MEELKVVFGGEEESEALSVLHRFHGGTIAEFVLPVFDVVVETAMLPDV